MKLTSAELVLTGLLIVYIAFFTHPAPEHLTNLLSSPVGHALALTGILYVTVYQSLIVGIFLGISYLMTAQQVTEYMENPAPKKEEPAQPSVSGVHPPAVQGAIAALMKKGDTRLPMESNKKGKPVEKPTETKAPKPTPTKAHETFASF
jgi:hypothetical protein